MPDEVEWYFEYNKDNYTLDMLDKEIEEDTGISLRDYLELGISWGIQMKKEVREFYITKIKEGLANCEERYRVFFNKLYPKGIESIEDDKLDHALFQVNNTLARINSTG